MKGIVSSSTEMQLVTFDLGDESFGIDIMKLQEIIRMPDITRLPGTAASIEGITDLRGKVGPIIDIRSHFGISKGETDN